MNRKHMALLFFCSALTALIIYPSVGFGAVSVGVKKGDWMEYTVATTGNVTGGHDIVSARIEITNVQGALVTVTLGTKDANGKQDNSVVTLNLEEGKLGDQFIIPANLNVGETFFDEYVGNVTIDGSEEKLVAGAERTVLYSLTEERSEYWDKSTGVLIEGDASTAGLITKLEKTNMWQPQTSLINAAVYVPLIAGIALLVAAFVIFIVRRRRKAASTSPNKKT